MSAGCRISKFRLKAGGAEISVFPTAEVEDDSCFIETLVWVLDQARKGHVLGYAMVYMVGNGESVKTIEAAKSAPERSGHHLLGAIRRMELEYIRRTWGGE